MSLAYGMAEAAATYHNHEIANAFSRVSQKLESYGDPFAEKLSKQDFQVIKFYKSLYE